MDYILLGVFLFISIVFSFLCSVWEAVLLSLPSSYGDVLLEEGKTIGKDIKALTEPENTEKALAGILTLNTIAHTVGAMGVGAMGVRIWQDGIMATAVIPVLMTLAILIFSEIIPKTLGKNNWKSLAPFTVRSLNIVLLILGPIIWLSKLITSFFVKEKKEKDKTSKTEIAVMADKGAADGAIEANESKIIKNLLRFDSILAKDVMTPRTVVVAANEIIPIIDFYESNKNLRFSRIPVFSNNKDNINGFVMKDDILSSIINGKGDQSLKSIVRDIMIVNEQFPIPDLFNQLMEKRGHIALVVDEFGGMSGIVTMEDVIETLLGMEIMDEFDNTADMQVLARKRWEMRAKNLGLIPSNAEDGTNL